MARLHGGWLLSLMKRHELPDPAEIGLLRAVGVVRHPQGLPRPRFQRVPVCFSDCGFRSDAGLGWRCSTPCCDL